MFTLEPVDGRKSFYGKCQVLEGTGDKKNVMYLRSYNTIVAEYNIDTKEMTIYGWYSTTTARHINAFLSHYGFPRASKKDIENWKNPESKE